MVDSGWWMDEREKSDNPYFFKRQDSLLQYNEYYPPSTIYYPRKILEKNFSALP
jgi:hypothetical protein